MNTPKKIYIGTTIWSEEKISDDSPAYLSEESVKQCLKQLIDEINRDYSFATTGRPFRYIRYDVDKTIEEFIERIKLQEKPSDEVGINGFNRLRR